MRCVCGQRLIVRCCSSVVSNAANAMARAEARVPENRDSTLRYHLSPGFLQPPSPNLAVTSNLRSFGEANVQRSQRRRGARNMGGLVCEICSRIANSACMQIGSSVKPAAGPGGARTKARPPLP